MVAAASAPVVLAAASAAVGATAKADPAASLRTTFDRFSATLNAGDLPGFLALFHDEAVIIDEDVPFRISKQEFIDHLGFHGRRNWESFAWVPRSVRVEVFTNTGFVAGSATFRGKPVDSGYRLRHMLQTMGWTRGMDGEWKIVSFHQSPLAGHVDHGSPG
jgi:ketosteroid isomerase-like protein